jgi:hypothetical protein
MSDLKSGDGSFMFINGNQYIGKFERDLFHGKGRYYFSKDEVLVG